MQPAFSLYIRDVHEVSHAHMYGLANRSKSQTSELFNFSMIDIENGDRRSEEILLIMTGNGSLFNTNMCSKVRKSD